MDAKVDEMEGPRSARRRVFIVRLWQESQGSQAWRGQVVDVNSGQTTAILNASELLACLQRLSENLTGDLQKRSGLI